jgi:Concanavalin A-like lectin/glucanases superfamily
MKKPVRKLNRALCHAATALVLACGIESIYASPYSTAVLADHPISYWRLNETSGTTAIDSTGTHNGGYTNAILGQVGYNLGSDPSALAASFGQLAVQDSFVGGMALDVATNANAVFSVEAWVNGLPLVPSAGIVGKGPSQSEEFYLDCGGSQNAFRFFVRGTNGNATNAVSTVIPDGNWHHLVGVCDQVNSNLYLYVDGRLSASTPDSGGIRTTPNLYMNIGSRQSSASGSYDLQYGGSISDVAVYNYALSAAQVQNHYLTAGIPPTITVQPVDNLSTNEGSAVTITAAVFGSAPLSYQWMLNGVPVPGQTTATFSTNSIPASFNAGSLNLHVSNAYGSADSSSTFLTIYSGVPQIVSDVQPAELALYVGNQHTYAVTAQGTAPLYYQWFKNGVAISGAIQSTYTATASAGTNGYSVVVSNTVAGGSIASSSTVNLIGAALPTGPYPTRILADSPIAYWRLDDSSNSTTAIDYVGGHNGTYNNVQLGVPGYSPIFDTNTAAIFGPSESYMVENDNSAGGIPLIDFAKPNGANAQFSVEVWVNGPAEQNSSGSAIVTKGPVGSDAFLIDASGSGGSFRFSTRKSGGGTSQIYSSSYPDGNWHHLVAVCDEANGSTTLYVDGVNAGTVTGVGGTGLYSSTYPIAIGSQSYGLGSSSQFNGIIDDVAVYNYALSSAQVLAHYNAAPLPPYFTVVPPTNIVAVLGQPVTLSASVLGSAPRTNQWYSNNVALAGQTNIFLAVNTSKVGTNVYTLRVSNTYGSVTNIGTTVEVPSGFGPPQLLADINPLSTSRYANQPLTFSVTAFGSSPMTYQWWFNSAPISGATNATYSITNLQSSNTGNYYCVVNNSLGTTNSSTSTLEVVPRPTSAYPVTVLHDHPVAYYRLDEPVGSPMGYDHVGGNDGLYTANVPSQIPLLGVTGYNSNYDTNTACKFGIGGGSSVDNYLGVTITNLSFAKPNGQSGAFSLEAWVNGPTGVAQVGGACIVAKGQGGGEQFSMDINNGFRFYVRNSLGNTLINAQGSSTFCGSPISGGWGMDGKWHHLVGVCDQVNSNLLLYVDGQLIGPNIITNGVVPPLAIAYDVGRSGTGTNGQIAAGMGINETTITTANENSIVIGNRNKNSNHVEPAAYSLPFQGTIDEVALYDYPLTPAQVYGHYAVAQGLPIPLTLQTTNGHPALTWATASPLETATSVTGPWTTVVGAASPYTINTTDSQRYYRLKVH